MARSRRPFIVVVSGAFRSACACRNDNQFPVRTPIDFALFTRAMPAAGSGASSPLSAASTASFRTADIRTLIEDEPSPRASRATRHALTVALVKPGRGSWLNQAKNSSSAQIVNALGDRRGDAVQHQRLQAAPLVRLWNNNQISHLGPHNGQYR